MEFVLIIAAVSLLILLLRLIPSKGKVGEKQFAQIGHIVISDSASALPTLQTAFSGEVVIIRNLLK